jgi:hypothetical protein
MRSLRARVTRLAGICLVGQLAVVVCLQTAMFASGVSTAVVTANCACVGGTMCPMHRTHPSTSPRPDRGACAFHGTVDPFGDMLTSLLGPSGIVPPVAQPFVPAFARLMLSQTDGVAFDVSRVPDFPPPRG